MNKKILYSVLVQLLFFTSSVSAYSLLTQSTPLDTVPLAKGVTSSIGAMTKRSQVYYSFTLASGVKNLSIVTTGTSGDADIYLSKDGVRDYKGSTWKSIKSASNEKITISAPQAGTYYLTVRAWTNTKNTKATLSYTGSTVASAVVKCSYSIPTSGCSYVKGPAYSSVTGCGLVLSCANPTLSGTSSGGGGGGSSAVAVPVYQTSIPGNTSSNFSNPTSILGNSSNQNNNTSPNTNTNTVITNSALSIPSTPVSTTTTVTTPVVPNVSNPVIVTTPSTPVTTSVTTPIQISNPTTPASSPEITYIVSPNPYDFVAGTVRPDSVSKTMPCTAGGTYVVAGGWYAVPGGFRFGSYFPVDGPLGVCPSVTTSNNTAVVNTPVVTAPVISTPAVVESALCGIASGVETTVAPSSNLCRVGTPSSVSGNGPYTWSCSSISGGQPAYCSAPRTATIAPTQVNGSCGLSQNQTLSSAPSTNLCSAGVASVVTTSGNTYSWSCSGSNGGNGTSCQASKAITTTPTTPVATGGVARPSYNTGTGFFVANGKLYDANGVEFRIRGVNRVHWDWPAADGIAKSKSNTQRISTDLTRSAASNVALMQNEMINNKIVPMPGSWEGTCNENPAVLTSIVDKWVAQASSWKTLDRYSIINIANEWGPTDSTVWRDSYINAIARMRAAGYTGTISVTSGGCGQDPFDVIKYGQAVLDSDPQKNIIFDVHVYGSFTRPKVLAWQVDYETSMAQLAATGLPIILGEFGPGRNVGNTTTITPTTIINTAEQYGFGWLAWAWEDTNLPNCGADDGWFSLTTYCGSFDGTNMNQLTTFGKEVVPIIMSKAQMATIFSGSTPTVPVTPVTPATPVTPVVPTTPTSNQTVTGTRVLGINAAGSEYISPVTGDRFSADQYFTGGETWYWSYYGTNPGGTQEKAPLYGTNRYSFSAFNYNIPVSNGTYTVKLRFIEGESSYAGRSPFNVSINGTQVLNNFDVATNAGGSNIALDKVFTTTVTDGKVSIVFTANQHDGRVLVSAIELYSGSSTNTTTVVPTQVNGSCGLSQNQTLSSAPSTNLCSAGVASVVTTSGNTYSWSCSGSNGGNGTSCQASKTVTVVTTVVTPVNTLAGGAGIDGPIPNVSNFNYTFCTALYMGGCSFSGLKTIRLGNGNQWVYRDYFGGFPGWYCNYANFPGSTSQQGDHCEVSDGIKTGTLTTPVNTQFANVHPFVDLSLIPLGSKGSNTLNIVSDPDTGAPNDIGAMRITCTFAKMAFNDPIVYPGQPGKSHLHTFFGNTDVNAYSTAESLATTGNSTCPGGIANRSSYWIPSLIDTSSNKAVVPSSAIWYYKTGYGGVVPSTVKPIPAGLRIIAGDANATGSQESKNIFWECQNTPGTRSATIPTNCPTGVPIALTVQFPQCWDGVNLDSANHQSHMAYPTGAGCPNTHPVPLPELSLHIQYGWSNLNTLRLSSDHNGNAAGLSLHADFFEAWDRNTMNTFITNCLNKSKDCHAYLLGNGTALLGE